MVEKREQTLPWATLRLAGLLGFFYLWTWLRIEPGLYYETDLIFPPFLRGVAFLKGFLPYPGGLVEYASALLSQSFAYSWGGALVLTALAGLTCWATDRVIRGMGMESARVAGLVPGVLILVAVNRGFMPLWAIIGPLTAILCFAAHLALSERGGIPRMTGLVALSLALYYTAGGPYLFFAGLVGLYEWGKGRYLAGLLSLLAMEGVPYLVGVHTSALTIDEAYLHGVPFRFEVCEVGPIALALMYGLWLLLAVGALVRSARRPKAGELEVEGRSAALSKSRRLDPGLRSVLVLVVAAATAVLTEDRVERKVLRLDYAAQRERWEEVLTRARHLPLRGYGRVLSHQINRALYETGRLPYDLFAYPQGPETLMVDMGPNPDPELDSLQMQARREVFFQLGDLDLQLGLINKAEHEAHEVLTVHGPHPEVLRRLAIINLVKRQPEAAAVFIAALSRSIGPGRKWASRLAAVGPEGDRELRRLRSIMLVEDAPWTPAEVKERCLALLRRNRKNRMAFEYLMAYYLLTRQPDKVAENIPRLDDFDYPGIPRLYEEAVLIEENRTRHVVDLGGRQISSATLDRFIGFGKTVSPYLQAGDMQKARAAGRERYGDTFLYYYVFRETGATRR